MLRLPQFSCRLADENLGLVEELVLRHLEVVRGRALEERRAGAGVRRASGRWMECSSHDPMGRSVGQRTLRMRPETS